MFCFVFHRLTDVERKAELATKGLEEVASRMSDLDSGVSQMEGWLTESIDLLKNRSKGSNQKAIKAKVDVLYNEKREREIDMNNIRGAARAIMEDDRVCDEFAVKESLGEIEAKWHELTEHLVQQVSLEVWEILEKLEQHYKYCIFLTILSMWSVGILVYMPEAYYDGGCRGRDCIVIGFTTTCAISAYRH